MVTRRKKYFTNWEGGDLMPRMNAKPQKLSTPAGNPVADDRDAEFQALAMDFARRGETESLAAMLRHGLPVNLVDATGNTLLMLASYNGNLETARMLLEHGADVDRRNDRGQTPLGGVAFKGYLEIAALLLEHGANVEADTGGGVTSPMFAAMFGRLNVATHLQAHRASLKRRNRPALSASRMVRLSAWIGRLCCCRHALKTI